MDSFKALLVNKQNGDFEVKVNHISMADLPKADVTIKVHYSSINYKDGLACMPNSHIIKNYPCIPGIDLAGTVVSSSNTRYREGDEVIVTGYELGISHFGGYSEYARVPAEWIVPLPKGLTLKEAMIFGTAGFTAALSLYRLEKNGLIPEQGPVVVTGASGGVGSIAVALLSKKGYHVVASTGKTSEHQFLKDLGATEVVSREDITPEKVKPLGKQLWAGAIDPVGGKTLAALLSNMKYQGAIAVSGLTGGVEVSATVYPFILRAVDILGIDSVYCPHDIRKEIWSRLATDLKPNNLFDLVSQEIIIDDLPLALSSILKGNSKGRTVVKL